MTKHPRQQASLFSSAIVLPAIKESVWKLAPQKVAKNPVMFVVEIGSVLTLLLFVVDLVTGRAGAPPLWFTARVPCSGFDRATHHAACQPGIIRVVVGPAAA